jgi:hypothetical protein
MFHILASFTIKSKKKDDTFLFSLASALIKKKLELCLSLSLIFSMPPSLQRMMINDDHKYTIGLMQQQQKQQQQPPSSSSSVNHLQSSRLTIYDNNNNHHHLQLTQKKSISSTQETKKKLH